MIERRHRDGGTESRALYSDDEVHRFALTRRWGPDAPVLFVMLNPSTATEVRNDPTIARCERRARDWGFGGVAIANLFGFRATRPADLKRASDPVGSGNDAALLDLAGEVGLILCAWGAHGNHLGRGAAVAALLRGQGRALHHLGLTRGGAPRHPLYVGYAQTVTAWD